MLINEVDKLFNSEFHFYFDRDDFFNCYVSFNFLEFIKHNSEYPSIYDNEQFINTIKNNVKFNFYLFDSTNIIKFDEISQIQLFENSNIITFLLRKNKKSLDSSYAVVCNIEFYDYLYQYITSEYSEFLGISEYQYSIFKNDLKSIIEKRYINSYMPSDPKRTYQFSSDFISFQTTEDKISNLYDIFSNNILLNNFKDFILSNETSRNITYNGNVPLTKHIKYNKEVKTLLYDYKEQVGNLEDYLQASIGLLSNYNRYDYKQIDFLNSIYLLTDDLKKKEESIKSYETITSIQSTACENKIFNQIQANELVDSDILYICNFLDNFNIDLNQFWVEDYKKLPVYLLEVMTRYNIYFLEKINESSMSETWSLLTNEKLNNLNAGKYLCMISTQNSDVQKNLIENYFILEV